jgi:hypothetical protein
MKTLFGVVVVLLLAGCGSVQKVQSGANTVGERMTVTIEGAWNHLDFPGIKPARVWTMEGVTIDELLIYSGIKDGQALHADDAPGNNKKKILFRSDMQIEEVVSAIEAVLSRDDSVFKLKKVEPYPFGGRKGFRFEYERIRKVDSVQQLGVGFGTIDQGELFAMVYQAPRLTFFPRHQARVELIAKSALIK